MYQTNFNTTSADNKDALISEQKNTINLMLVFVIVSMALTLMYFLMGLLNNYISRENNFSSKYFSYTKYVYTFFSILELIAIVIIAALLKNAKVRIWFIVFAALKLIATVYWTYTYYK